MSHYWSIFEELIATPFEHMSLIWGIVPLYFGLLLNEATSSKASYRTAVQTGFSFIWAAAQWLYQYFGAEGNQRLHAITITTISINLVVTFLVMIMGVVALVSGLRRKFPPYGRFLGQTRFANYFTIAIYPMQSHWLNWSWDRLMAIIVFGVPVWLALYFGLMPLRKGK
jgi:hypothetical protein